jgi:hypothetical protein
MEYTSKNVTVNVELFDGSDFSKIAALVGSDRVSKTSNGSLQVKQSDDVWTTIPAGWYAGIYPDDGEVIIFGDMAFRRFFS